MFEKLKEFLFGKPIVDDIHLKYQGILDEIKRERRKLEETIAEHKKLLTKPTISVNPLEEGKTKSNTKNVTSVPARPAPPLPPPSRIQGW